MKIIRIILFVFIIVGVSLLFTQKMWVPKIVNTILKYEGIDTTEIDKIEPDPVIKKTEIIHGKIIGNNLEDVLTGAYLHIKRLNTDENIFVLYEPFRKDGNQICLGGPRANHLPLEVGMTVEVKGERVFEVNGVKVENIFISTCRLKEFYIKVISK